MYNILTSTAATASSIVGGSSSSLVLILILVVLCFLLIYSVSKRKYKAEMLRSSIKTDDSIYPEVGKKIKALAKVLLVLMMIPSVLLGIGIIVLFAQSKSEQLTVVGFIIGIGVIALGYFFAWLSNILLYAYGELVDKTVSIESYLTGKKTVVE